MAILELDFKGTRAVTRLVGSDYVPPGAYRLQVKDVALRTTSNGRPMVTVTFSVAAGEHSGKSLMENYVLPRPDSNDSLFPLERLKGLLVSLGIPEEKLASRVKIDTAALVGRFFVAEVDDETMPATDTYPERIRSRVVAYHPAGNTVRPTEAPSPRLAAEAPSPAVAAFEEAGPEETAPIAHGEEATTPIDDMFEGL